LNQPVGGLRGLRAALPIPDASILEPPLVPRPNLHRYSRRHSTLELANPPWDLSSAVARSESLHGGTPQGQRGERIAFKPGSVLALGPLSPGSGEARETEQVSWYSAESFFIRRRGSALIEDRCFQDDQGSDREPRPV
jgi:hypothetical protein